VGEHLSAPLSALCPIPLDLASGDRRHRRHHRIRCGCLACNPDHSRDQRRGGSTELFAAASFDRITVRRTSETDAFSAPRMRTPRGPSRTLWSLHRTVSTSDIPLSPAGTPESESFPPDVLSFRQRVDPRFTACLRRAEEELTCWSEDPASPCWLRARRARARERLPSYYELTSRDP